jgi:hypothetical protein
MLKPTKWKMVGFVLSNSSRAPRDDTTPDPMLVGDPILILVQFMAC